MAGKDLQLISERAECLHSAAVIAGPDGTKAYGLSTDADRCLECGWRAFEQALGKRVELPPVQIIWWPTEKSEDGNWVAECFSWDPEPGEPSLVGRGNTPGEAMKNLAGIISSSLKDQPQ